MKERAQMFAMGMMLMLTTTLIISIFTSRLNVESKDSCEYTEIPEEAVVEVAEPVETLEEPVYVTSEKTYFDDALFIGDSRTVGLCEYGDLKNADYFASTGMSIYKLWKETVSVESVGKVTLKELLDIKDYEKIYIMLGINELGYDSEKTITKFEDTISRLKDSQTEALIYVCANLHVTRARSDGDDLINNQKIDLFNQKLEALTDNKRVYYIDVNEEFDDENGNLRAECTSDNVHVYAKYYQDWTNWLCEHTVQRGN